MPIELIVPPMGESITEVQIGAWRKQPGDPVKRDESVVELESDKATVDLPAPIAGAITKVLKKEGERANVGEVIGYMDEAAAPATKAAPPAQPSAEKPAVPKAAEASARIMPAARRAMEEQGVKLSDVSATGPGGRVLKEDVLRAAPSGAAPAGGGRSSP